MKCIIIDDNELAIKTLSSLIANFCPNILVLGSSQTILGGVNLINEFNPDLVFLDVEIKNEKGFELFSYFTEQTFSVIFTTAHEKYAYLAMKNNCFDYLLKPIDPAELMKSILKYVQDQKIKLQLNPSVNISSKRIAFILDNEYLFIEETEILYLKADGKYSDIVTKNKTHKSSKNLGEIEPFLTNSFFRCHKGCIVNMNYVAKFIKDDMSIVLKDETVLDLASRRKEEFLKLFYRM